MSACSTISLSDRQSLALFLIFFPQLAVIGPFIRTLTGLNTDISFPTTRCSATDYFQPVANTLMSMFRHCTTTTTSPNCLVCTVVEGAQYLTESLRDTRALSGGTERIQMNSTMTLRRSFASGTEKGSFYCAWLLVPEPAILFFSTNCSRYLSAAASSGNGGSCRYSVIIHRQTSHHHCSRRELDDRSWRPWPRSTTSPPLRSRTTARSFASLPDSNDEADNAKHTTTLTPFLLADIGEGIKEVELLQWYVSVGDAVQQFDRVCEVQSDKATVEITSRYDGVVASLAGETGSMVQVGQALLHLQTATAATGGTSDRSLTTAYSMNATTAPTTSAFGQKLQDTADHAATEARLSIPTVASQFHLASDDDGDDHAGHRAASAWHASPAVRKLGRDYSIDVGYHKGNGTGGPRPQDGSHHLLEGTGALEGHAAGNSSSNNTGHHQQHHASRAPHWTPSQ